MASELSQLTREAAELQLNIDRARDRVQRLVITAPMAGRIKGLQTQTVGGVVAPGATVMEIVPDLARPLVEVRISTRDIGHIHPGQQAKIKVQTYDYTRYGMIEGRVARISPTTFTPEEGSPYYKAYIDPDEEFVGGDRDRPVISGMTVIADIVTGNRSLLAYILSPIRLSVDAALRER
ncbi:HlyD family efflux transporter periplasmic adaptor subunit [Breoghania sp.]|uniref:HlyD family efflux transporter periplasmic adaptor subunit n=1 Tax=Breoghania sp. TaxID=2065378 RepID=UPI00261A97BA|nr:HlyD family efflux transporter periplasmic adaptor subunit [Breoghania sp.]MDJ0933318.1 HlyD family efflux transporter periplasmic adaptor subunit [Breoghania sp.]